MVDATIRTQDIKCLPYAGFVLAELLCLPMSKEIILSILVKTLGSRRTSVFDWSVSTMAEQRQEPEQEQDQEKDQEHEH